MLDAERVANVVRSAIYKPDWKFVVTYVVPYLVDVQIEWAVRDTSNPPAYEQRLVKPFYAFLTISCEDVNSDADVLRQLLESAIDLERRSLYHEGREFLRVAGEGFEFDAPFHPHTAQGIATFEGTNSYQLEENTALPTR